MNIEEARGFVFQALREDTCPRFETLVDSIGIIKAKAEKTNVDLTRLGYLGGTHLLTQEQRTLLLEVVWSLIIQGILIPGMNDNNPSWPFLRVTEYGKKCLAEDRILPHDPEGFLRDFQREVPSADQIVVEYLTESLQCYIHGLYRAAAIMLGGASEQAVLLMIESYATSISDQAAKIAFESSIQKTQSIFRKYELFKKKLHGFQQNLPRDLNENLDSLLGGIFDMIRSSRNDAGHPASGGAVSRDAVYSHLRLFPPYYKRINDLTAWFAANPT